MLEVYQERTYRVPTCDLMRSLCQLHMTVCYLSLVANHVWETG